MIKIKADLKSGPLYIFGLSALNIEKLQAGRPIQIDLTKMGGTGEVIIMAGDTEESMFQEFRDLVGPDTKITFKDQP